MIYRTSFLLFFIYAFLVGCQSKQENSGELKQRVVNFVENSKEIVVFGYVDFLKVKNKGRINELEEVGSFINQQIKSLEKSLNLNEKVHLVMKGPLNQKGKPSTIYSFVQIKNLTKLQHLFEDMGFFLAQEGNIRYYDNEGIAIGHDEHYVIIVSTNADEDVRTMLMEAFEDIYKERKNQELIDIISQETDLLLLTKLESILPELSAYNHKLEPEKKKKIEELFKDGHLSFNLSFNKGNIEGKLELLNINDKLNNHLIFKDTIDKELFNYLGTKPPLLTMATAINMERFDEVFSLFYPQRPREFLRSFGSYGMLLEGLMGESLANVTNGNIGVYIPLMSDESKVRPQNYPSYIRSVIGWGKEKQNMLDLIASLSEVGTLSQLKNGLYQYEESTFKPEEDYLIYTYGNIENEITAPLKPSESKMALDKYPFSLFLDVKNSRQEFIYPDEVKSSVQLINHLNISANNNEIIIKIDFNNQEENALVLLLRALQEDLRSNIQGTFN